MGCHLHYDRSVGQIVEAKMGKIEGRDDPEFDRIARPKGVASWRTVNRIANKKPEFFEALPPTNYKVRNVSRENEQMERARIKATKAYMDEPHLIGARWIQLWHANNSAAAIKAYGLMVSHSFRPNLGERFRWILTRRGRTIYGCLFPMNSSEWTEEQWTFYNLYQEMKRGPKKQGHEFSELLTQEVQIEFTDEDPVEFIRSGRQPCDPFNSARARNQAARYDRAKEKEQS